MATPKKKKSAMKDFAGTVSTAIVIMIVLVIFVFPSFYGDKGAKKLPDEIESITEALEAYRSEKGNFPVGTRSEISKALLDAGLEHERVDKSGALLDPWEIPYRILTSNDGYVIRSAGKNKTFDAGTSKDSDDIFHGSR